MILFVTYYEGGYWTQLSEEELQNQWNQGIRFAALRCGKWIYDFILKELGHNPIRYYNNGR